MIRCIERVLRDGCGINLSDAIHSDEFQLLQEQQDTLRERHAADSDQGIALRAGHLVMGELLNTLPESEALKAAYCRKSEFGAGIDCRAMIEFVGSRLVQAAQKCLPDAVRDLAQRWREADAEAQIQIAHQLFRVFRSETQDSEGDLTMASVWEKMAEKMQHVDVERCVLPGLYGAWDRDTCPANCQGKSQMLTAFARLAGAPAMAANPLRHARRELATLRQKIRDAVASDLEERGLMDGDTSLMESLRASYLDDGLDFEEHFHIGVALQLKDGRWVLIDPHGLVWGVFPEEWQLTTAFNMLNKYADVLPGLQLLRHDQGRCAEVLHQKEAEASDILERSRRMEERIHNGNVATVIDLANMIASSDDFNLLLWLDREPKSEEMPDWVEAGSQSRELAALVIVMGGEDKMFDYAQLLDPMFLESRIKSWLTLYHAEAVNLLMEQLSEAGALLHPVCEFGRPEYHLAIAALNSLAFRGNRRDSSINQFFLDYSFDQVTLYNALSECRWDGNPAVAQAAGSALKALPCVHAHCGWRLHWL